MTTAIAERRVYHRYPLHLPIRYRLNGAHSSAVVGTGLTQNLSSAGIAFVSDAVMNIGSVIDIWVSWPVDGNETKLELRMTGRVVWCNGMETAIQVKRHGFVHVEPSRNDGAGTAGSLPNAPARAPLT